MIDPLISIRVLRSSRTFIPRERFACEYQLDAIDPTEIVAVEASVMWYTEGKGDEDLAVHYFERRTPTDSIDGDLRALRRFDCELPNSPLSYSGFLFKIRWCVRVRVFMKSGRDLFSDELFQIGQIPAVEAPPPVAAAVP
ncbi:MAG TPA: hypothetical protein VL096_13910 [Pirellulaceae bacterium]|nr:hypothetical protein [Pirellulaceae bacterium]